MSLVTTVIRNAVSHVACEYSEMIEVHRAVESYYDEHGRYQEQEAEKIIIKANVQRARSDELMDLEEGRRTREAIKIYSIDELRTSSVDKRVQPDVVIWRDVEYQIDKVDNWSEAGGYFKAIATRKGQ